MSQGFSWNTPAPQLRLFDESACDADRGPPPPGTFTADVTLYELYQAWIKPVWLKEQQCDPKTIAEYDRSLALWVQFTGDPPLESLDLARDERGEVEHFVEQVTAAFVAGLAGLKGKRGAPQSAFTALRRVTNVQSCLRLAGWPDGRRKGKKLIRMVPALPRPTVPEIDPEGPQVWELRKILDAAERMQVPRLAGISPAVFWRSLVRLAFNTAERRGALLALKFADVRELREQRSLPGCEEPGEVCSFELHVPAVVRKGHKKKGLVIPLNDAALGAVRELETACPRELLYPWPHTLRYFAECWKQLVVELAGFPDEPRFHFHRIRSTAISEATAINEQAGVMLAGHSSAEVTRKHYQQRRLLRQTLPQMPQL